MRKVFVLALIWTVFGYSVDDVSVTVYNQDFGVVKQGITLDLKRGENDVIVSDIARHLQRDSVILRDKNNPKAFKILEQNFESDPLSEDLLLYKNEGKEVEFKVMQYDEVTKTNKEVIKKAKIIRSAYVPHIQAYSRYGGQYSYAQQSYSSQYGAGQAILEMEGKIVFGLPGRPVFSELGTDSFIKPSIMWKIQSEEQGKRNAEFSYMTGGMSWDATYNCVVPEKGDVMDILGWVNIDNNCGRHFRNASIKLMGGDVSKVNNQQRNDAYYASEQSRLRGAMRDATGVDVKEFDEFHLYSLPRKVDLLDRENKQIEFIRAERVNGQRFYVYDGVKFDQNNNYGYDDYSRKTRVDYGSKCNKKVWNIFEFKNSEENNLGIALPKGKIKMYRKDTGGSNEFIGEDSIDHTAKGETVKVYLGNVFDVTGERKQTAYKLSNDQSSADESFEITLRNQKKDKVVVRVVEHMYRWLNWDISEDSDIYKKNDSRTIEFRAEIEPGKEKKINYKVTYNWK
ncbi:MAG: hypothetical protein A2231_13070 [Candidatus Firestonebacteria bacterium RIFOXYA2_FULL_40_8]|nr:MAG: hypothetical protein A2231_13070 [Candidatus Firestonebacteria bacterium RIFOXYA2_FULL_40_8]